MQQQSGRETQRGLGVRYKHTTPVLHGRATKKSDEGAQHRLTTNPKGQKTVEKTGRSIRQKRPF
eukprot:1157543-Pelagomonas_calceolata.AAC.14